MNTARNILAAFKAQSFSSGVLACFVLMWSSVGAAAAVLVTTKTPELQLDPLLVVLACVISTLAGGTSLAVRVNNLLMGGEVGEDGMPKPPQPLVRPWLFAAAHMGGSWMAGVAAFLMGRSNDWGVWTVLLGVLFMSFLGAKGIELAAERWLSVVRMPGAEGAKR